MQINSESLGCDYCGDTVTGDFTYYSFDIKVVKKVRVGWFEDKISVLSVDLCERCMELFRQRLLEVARVVTETPTRCDISGADCSRDEKYYKCSISRVQVNMSGQQYICSKCNKPRNPQDGPCPCSEDAHTLAKEAKVDVDDSYVSLNISVAMYEQFSAHVQYIKGLGDNEWTS